MVSTDAGNSPAQAVAQHAWATWAACSDDRLVHAIGSSSLQPGQNDLPVSPLRRLSILRRVDRSRSQSIAVDHRSRWPAHVYATALTLTLTLTLWSDPHTLQICQFLGSFHFI